MPLPLLDQMRNTEGWNNFVDIFKQKDDDYQKYDEQNNLAIDLFLEGKNIEAFKAFASAETYLGRSLATFESYRDGFQRRYKKDDVSDEDKAKLDNRMQNLINSLHSETTIVTSRRLKAAELIPIEQLEKKNLNKQSPVEANFTRLSKEALEQALDNLSHRDDRPVSNYSVGEICLSTGDYDNAIHYFERALLQIKGQESNLDHSLIQHIEIMKQEAQQLQSKLSSSDSEGASPASAGSERSSPIPGSASTSQGSTEPLPESVTDSYTQLIHKNEVLNKITIPSAGREVEKAQGLHAMLLDDEKEGRATEMSSEEGYNKYQEALSKYSKVIDEWNETVREIAGLVKRHPELRDYKVTSNVEPENGPVVDIWKRTSSTASDVQLQATLQNQAERSTTDRISLGTFDENPLFTSSQQDVASAARKGNSQPTITSSQAAQQLMTYFSDALQHDYYKEALGQINKGNELAGEGNYSDAIEQYRSGLDILKRFREVLTRPTVLEGLENPDKLMVNAHHANVLHQVVTAIKTGEKQLEYAEKLLAEVQRPHLTEEETHKLVDQALEQRKTIFHEENQSQIMRSDASSASARPESSPMISTPPSTPAPEAPQPTSRTVSSFDVLMGRNIAASTSATPAPTSGAPQPMHHTPTFLSSFDVLVGKNLPASVSETVTPGAASGHTTKSHTEDDLDKLLRQLDQNPTEGQTAIQGTSGVTHNVSSEAEMLMEMGGTNPDKIRETSLHNAIDHFYQNDENYQGYQEYLSKAHEFYANGDFGKAILAMEVAERNLKACRETIETYEQQLQNQMQKTSNLQQSTLPSLLSSLKSNIDTLVQQTAYFKLYVGQEMKDKQQQTAPSAQGPQRSEATDFKSNDPGRGSSGPGSRT